MSRRLLYRDALFYMHTPPRGYHVEGPWRLERAYRGLAEAGLLPHLEERPAPPPARARRELEMVHSPSYIELIDRVASMGGDYIDPDTYVGPYTAMAGYAVAAATLDALAEVKDGGVALVLARPPGHHAGREGSAMGAPTLGFCIFNASALAALRAADMGYKVLAIDFDLHHGNGTQEILYDDPRVVHLDLHQDPATIYPGTGWPWQTGEGEAKGTKLNAVLPPFSGDDIYTYMFDAVLDLALEALGGAPDIVVVDAGFDAYRGDGLGLLELTINAYRHIAHRIRKLADRIIVVLEGGYSSGLEKAFPVFTASLMDIDAATWTEEETRSPRKVWEAAGKNLRRLEEALRAPG